ncbi:hypothetical protein Tco_1030513 [Tanacetum coccineum]|uniref:Uncharacterized protein n=1 Tax=Tanacetum coccineum TaxID=301880 RepID=A0ABQ5G8P6_9ASTR
MGTIVQVFPYARRANLKTSGPNIKVNGHPYQTLHKEGTYNRGDPGSQNVPHGPKRNSGRSSDVNPKQAQFVVFPDCERLSIAVILTSELHILSPSM